MKLPLFHAALASCLLPHPLLWAQDEPAGGTRAQAAHVVVVVWDGLRPDSVREEDTPTLARLAREGVFFTRHHAVYPTSTEVNGTAMATGCYPGTSGLIANREYRSGIDPLKPVATEGPETIRKGDLLSGGRYLQRLTLAERLQSEGDRTLITSTKRVVLLQDRGLGERDPRKESGDSVTLFEGRTVPPDAAATLGNALGSPFPPDIQLPNTAADQWTTHALTDVLWKAGLPKFSVLWLSDPDYTQHKFGPESPQARKALAGCDGNLAAVLAALDAGNWRDSTDVFVVSDHGFSTIGQGVDVAQRLADAGFRAAREFKEPPKAGDVVVDGLGGLGLPLRGGARRGDDRPPGEVPARLRLRRGDPDARRLAGHLPAPGGAHRLGRSAGRGGGVALDRRQKRPGAAGGGRLRRRGAPGTGHARLAEPV